MRHLARRGGEPNPNPSPSPSPNPSPSPSPSSDPNPNPNSNPNPHPQQVSLRQQFEGVRSSREGLFLRAFNHISKGIDDIYKDLTQAILARMSD